MKPNIILFIQRALELSGHLTLPNLSNSVRVAKLRYIQSVYETPEYRNPDTLVHGLLPPPLRWLSMLQAKIQLSRLRRFPFYYYLIARTKHYDQVFIDAISSDIKYVINIGCGTDTRAYRFAAELKQKGKEVLECDQAETIVVKQRLAERIWQTDHVTYVSVDLNDSVWPDLEYRLNKISSVALVMLEGVSPYIDQLSFDRFLQFLAIKLKPGSVIAYDYKIRSDAVNIDPHDQSNGLFRLPGTKNDVISYHEALGFEVKYLELSSELLSRLLPNLAMRGTPLFTDDGLLQLAVPRQSETFPNGRRVTGLRPHVALE